MINNNEIYDLKYHIAEYVTPRLKKFKDKFEKGESPSIQTFLEEENFLGRKLTYDESAKIWVKILDEMIFPFEYLIDEEKFEDLDRDELYQKINKGLELFAKYYLDLWI